jgi:hypothetical protein
VLQGLPIFLFIGCYLVALRRNSNMAAQLGNIICQKFVKSLATSHLKCRPFPFRHELSWRNSQDNRRVTSASDQFTSNLPQFYAGQCRAHNRQQDEARLYRMKSRENWTKPGEKTMRLRGNTKKPWQGLNIRSANCDPVSKPKRLP